MGASIDIDTGLVVAAADELRGATARVEATLAPPHLAGTLSVLEQAVAGAWPAPYAAVLAAATTIRTSPDLAVTTGGATGHLSGGATAGDLVWGVEYGGGQRVGPISAGRRSRAHRRRTTAQFHGQHLAATHAIDDTADTAAERLADDLAQAVAP